MKKHFKSFVFLAIAFSFSAGIFTALYKKESHYGVATLASSTADNLVVGVKILEKAPGDAPRTDNKMLLIGIDCASANNSNCIGVDATIFEGERLQKIDPKFLFLVNSTGVQGVYSFNVKKQKYDPEDKKAELPPQLVDAKHLNREIYTRNPVDKIVEIADAILPVKIFKSVTTFYGEAKELFANRENERGREAVYLMELIEGALIDGSHPILQKYFPPDVVNGEMFPNRQLLAVGAALGLRFHPTAETAALFARSTNRLDFYLAKALLNRDASSGKAEELIGYADRMGLNVTPIGEHFALISYDPSKWKDSRVWNGHGLQAKNPAEYEKTMTEWRKVQEGSSRIPVVAPLPNLVPIGIMALSTHRYVSAVHFFETDHNRREALLQTLYQFSEEVDAVIAPSNPAIWAISVARDFFEVRFAWRQSPFFESVNEKTMEMGRLEALLEADVWSVDWSQTDDDAIAYLVKSQFKLSRTQDEDVMKVVRNHDNLEARNRAINQLLASAALSQSGVVGGTLGGRGDAERWADTRRARWGRLVRWISDKGNLQNLSETLTERAKEAAVDNEKATAKFEIHEQKKLAKEKIREDKLSAAPPICYKNGRLEPGACSAEYFDSGRPVIFFGIDGLRPDVLERYKNAHMKVTGEEVIPNIKKYFLSGSAEMKNSFNSHSVSTGAWATIFTGYEPDYHGVLMSSNPSRNPSNKLVDYLDYLGDNHLEIFANDESHTLQKIHRAGIKWLPEYVEEDRRITVLSPVHDKVFIPFKDTGKAVGQSKGEFLYGIMSDVEQIDVGQAIHNAELIKRNPGRYRLVLNYYASVDHFAHTTNSVLDRALHSVDKAVGIVMEAVKKDPYLKDAVLVLVSDHGLSGGDEDFDPTRKYLTKAHFVDNVGFSLHSLFVGDIPNYAPEYRFVIGTTKSCEDRDLPSDLDIQKPFSTYNGYRSVIPSRPDTCRGTRTFKNHAHTEYRHGWTMLLESQGDGRVTGSILDEPNNPQKRRSLYELTHYTNLEMKHAFEKATKSGLKWQSTRDIPADLLNYVAGNMQGKAEVIEALRKLHGNHPVDIFTMAIQGQNERATLEKIAGVQDEENIRDPILIMSKDDATNSFKEALLFVRDEPDRRTQTYRYVLVKNVKQNQLRGEITGERIKKGADYWRHDPLVKVSMYDGTFGSSAERTSLDPDTWLTDKNILKILLYNESVTGVKELRPTAIFATAHILTMNLYLKKVNPEYYDYLLTEAPDFLAFSNEGFHFNPTNNHQADHGGNNRTTVQNTFIINDGQLSSRTIDVPVLTRDITPTVLDYLGVDNAETKRIPGDSMKKFIEE